MKKQMWMMSLVLRMVAGRRMIRMMVICVLAAGVLVGQADGALLSINNPSFDMNDLDLIPTGEGVTPAHWVWFPSANTQRGMGNDTSVSPVDGSNYAYIYTMAAGASAYLQQTLTGQKAEPGKTYTLSVLVGHVSNPSAPTHWPFDNVSLQLKSGTTLLAQTLIGTQVGAQPAPAAGVAQYYTATYIAPQTGVPTDDLSIVLAVAGVNGGVELATFDNVTLDMVPEPTTLGLLAMGGLAGLLRRKRN